MPQQAATKLTCEVCGATGYVTGDPPYEGWNRTDYGVLCSGECEIAAFVRQWAHAPNMSHRGPNWPPPWMPA